MQAMGVEYSEVKTNGHTGLVPVVCRRTGTVIAGKPAGSLENAGVPGIPGTTVYLG